MKIRKKIGVYLGLVLFIMQGLTGTAYADNTDTVNTDAAIMGETPPPPPDTTEPVHEPTSYTQDIFFPRKTLKGIYSSADLYFNIPDYWDVKYVYAQIQYDVSQLLEGKRSSVTLSINDVPIQSYRLEYQNGSSQILYVQIPMSEVRTGYNTLKITAYARLFDEEGCVDEESGANWLRIDEASHIRCGYESKDPEHRLSYFPYPFMSTYNPTGEGLVIAVSDQASNGEIAAAMNLMAALSTDTKERNDIQVCLLSDLANKNPSRTIVISDYENLPQEYKDRAAKAPDSTENATVTFTDDAQGKPLLLITSMADESLLEAAYMLMDKSRTSQEYTHAATVEKGSAQIAMDATQKNDMMAGHYTFEDIMGSGMSFVGPFHQENYLYLPVSKDFVLSEGGKIALKFRYSENLDFTRSLITVCWGEVPIASKRLSKENASGDELNFEIPRDVIGTSAGSIKISFDLEIADMLCTPRQSDMPWAYVSRESAVFLPSSSDAALSFDLQAFPFRRDGRFNDVMLVVSDAPSSGELNLLGQIVAMYGNGVKPYGSFLVRRAGAFTEADGDYNLITTGTYGSNPWIPQINDKLSFRYTPDGTGFESNEQLILSKEYAGTIGIMQLIKSPYALNRGVLAVTGSSSETLLNVERFLRESRQRSKITKDCVIIAPDSSATAFQFYQTTAGKKEPAPIEKLVRNKRSVIFTAVATSAMFMMLIAVIIILLRMRSYRKKDEK
ncbi:cellulose biosynthesis cyclic di-GMP-binding regulatory protein BcsB [Lacrimispora sp. JR3]|uniref:cellulose biosynthesis cyclic di-GMP-binding regulatory protein BcsB n=1 Tax=Lacrimispora sinapis TaxID=3111456 RepID=UPI0037483D4E